MTLFLTDVSRHQVERPDALDLAKAKAAGMNAVNIQLDRGRQDDVLPGWAREYVEGARSLGMGVACYRWLDARIGGAESARRAFDRMQHLGIGDTPHTVDCEDTATEQHLRDYVTTMTGLLGRPIAIYSGRWWLQPRGWQVDDLSPFLWAAPSTGYLTEYPGDDSPHWTVAYGGYRILAAMQYAVKPLPDTGMCSLSAIRDPAVWTALTGGPMAWFVNRALTNFRNAVNAKYPRRDKGSDGTIGDAAHAASTSDHNPDPDGSVDAWDMDVDLNGAGQPYSGDVEALKAVFQAHESSQYWIHNRVIASRSDGPWRRRTYTGDNPHDKHVHWNTRQSHENSNAPWVLGTTPQGDDDMIRVLKVNQANGVTAFYAAVAGRPMVSIANGAELEEWRKMATAARAGAEVTVPEAYLKAFEGDPDLVDIPGGEQLSAVVASAIDSRIPAIVAAVNDDAAERGKE